MFVTTPQRELELEAHRALNSAQRAGLAVTTLPVWSWHRRGEFVVGRAFVRSPWVRGQAPNRPSGISHRPRWQLIAWRRGRPVKSLTQFACGQRSTWARGEAAPTGRPCGRCMLATGEATIRPR